jgi:hypothetical protein
LASSSQDGQFAVFIPTSMHLVQDNEQEVAKILNIEVLFLAEGNEFFP